jgi:hypothetical protein
MPNDLNLKFLASTNWGSLNRSREDNKERANTNKIFTNMISCKLVQDGNSADFCYRQVGKSSANFRGITFAKYLLSLLVYYFASK